MDSAFSVDGGIVKVTPEAQVAFLFAVGGCEDCHNSCNLKSGLNISYFNMGVIFGCSCSVILMTS